MGGMWGACGGHVGGMRQFWGKPFLNSSSARTVHAVASSPVPLFPA